LNQCGRYGGQTANSFGAFALMFSMSRDAIKYWVRAGDDDVLNEMGGCAVAGTVQGLSRQDTHNTRGRQGSRSRRGQ